MEAYDLQMLKELFDLLTMFFSLILKEHYVFICY